MLLLGLTEFSGFIGLLALVVAAATLSNVMGFLHIPQDLAKFISALELSPHSLILTLAVSAGLVAYILSACRRDPQISEGGVIAEAGSIRPSCFSDSQC